MLTASINKYSARRKETTAEYIFKLRGQLRAVLATERRAVHRNKRNIDKARKMNTGRNTMGEKRELNIRERPIRKWPYPRNRILAQSWMV
jgi:hypothetical protein